MKKRMLGLATAACMLAPVAAGAQVAEGIYIGAGGGLNYHEEADIGGVRFNGDADFDLGFALMGVIGYSFGGPRIEGELSYRSNSTDKATVINPVTNNVARRPDGDLDTIALMANLYYDFDIGSFVTPYIGAGIGGAYAEYDDIGEEVVFAYQGIVGASFYLDENIDAFVDYRYFATTEIQGSDLGRAANIDNKNHTLMVGLRYSFGPLFDSSSSMAAAPAPAPAPPPVVRPVAPPPLTAAAPAERPPAERQFMVFFDFDSAVIRADGGQVVRDAAAAAQVVTLTRIDVTGHADRSGPSAYNDRLSRRRALAVKRELVANGVPEKDIIIYARGERDPLVPTQDGVREPRNRRVEIVLN